MPESDFKLNDADLSVLRGVRDMPLVSTGELADVLGVVFSTVSRRLGRLEKLGLVDSALMGATFPAARRYRLTPDGASRFLKPEVDFHLNRKLNALAGLLPAVEWFYRLVIKLPELAQMGEFRSFHWRLEQGVDAMVHYDGGTVALIWSGPWQTEAALNKRLEDLGDASSENGGWPALLCVVASDLWQAYRTSGALADFGLDDRTLVVCSETGEMVGKPVLNGGAALLGLTPLRGSLVDTVPAALPRMMGGVRSGADANLVYRVMYLVEQFPGARVSVMSRGLGSHTRYVSKKLKRLVEEGMLIQIGGHYYLSDKALVISARRDRVHVSRPRRRFGPREGGLPAVARYRRHDAATFSVVSVFQDAGFSVAGGWRGEDYTGGKDAIAPDALIYMGDGSSGGAGWYYLEYERRADSARRVASKLRGYFSRSSGREPLPVLMAARNDLVAAEFRRQAAAADYPLWAASIGSIKIDDPCSIWGKKTAWIDALGNPGVFLPPA